MGYQVPNRNIQDIENKKTALEHKYGFGKGSDRTRGIVTGIREVLKGPERPKKSWGCNEELKSELKPGKSCQRLWNEAEPRMGLSKARQKLSENCKAAGCLASLGKARQKPQGTRERSRAPCGPQQSLAKAIRCSGKPQSPTWALAKPSKSHQRLWNAAGPLAVFSKAWLKPSDSLE